MDLSKLSDDDLVAIAAGDMSRVSDQGLFWITSDFSDPSTTEASDYKFQARAKKHKTTWGEDYELAKTNAEKLGRAATMQIGLPFIAAYDKLTGSDIGTGIVEGYEDVKGDLDRADAAYSWKDRGAGVLTEAPVAVGAMLNPVTATGYVIGRSQMAGEQALAQGASARQAVQEGVTSGVTNAFLRSAPVAVGGKLSTRVGTGAAAGVASVPVETAVLNALRRDPVQSGESKLPQLPHSDNPWDYALGAIIGGAAGAATRNKTFAKKSEGTVDDTVRQPTEAERVNLDRIAIVAANYRSTNSFLERAKLQIDSLIAENTRLEQGNYSPDKLEGVLAIISKNNKKIESIQKKIEESTLVQEQRLEELINRMPEEGLPATEGTDTPKVRLAGLKPDGTIYLNKPAIEQDFHNNFSYIFEGEGITGHQKQKVFKVLGLSREDFATLIPDVATYERFLEAHEKSHKDHDDRANYPRNAEGKLDLLHPDAIKIESRATQDALNFIQNNKPSAAKPTTWTLDTILATRTSTRTAPVQVNGVFIRSDDTGRIDHAKAQQEVISATLTSPDTSLNPVSRRYFGKQQSKDIADKHPLLTYTYEAIQHAENVATMFKRNIASGMGTAVREIKGHPIFNIGHARDAKAASVLLETATDADVLAVGKVFVDGFIHQKTYEQALMDSGNKLTARQRNLYLALMRQFNQAFELEQQIRKDNGLPALPFRPGHLPSLRSGNYALFVKDANGIVHLERVRSPHEARLFMKQLPEGFYVDRVLDIKKDLGDVSPEELAQMRQAFADEFQVRAELDKKQFGTNLYGIKTQHDLFREGLTGFLGTRWNRTDHETARDFRDMFTKGVEERANGLKRALLEHSTGYVMQALKQVPANKAMGFENAVDWANTWLDSALGKHNASEKVDHYLRNAADTFVSTIYNTISKDKYWYPRIPTIDRGLGIAANMFYLSTLMNRAGFWLQSFLTYPQAARHLFTEGTSFGDAMSAFGEGFILATSGKDPDFRKSIAFIAKERDTFAPQFKNEINRMPFFEFSKKPKTIMEWATGQKQSAAADSASRYYTYATFYAKHKKDGLSGKALWEKAAADTEATMVMYDNANASPLIQNAGLLGQGIAPLTKFPTAQQGHLVADFKRMVSGIKGGKYSEVNPLIITGITTAMMAGAQGLPLLVEYELLADYFGWPTLTEWFLSQPKSPLRTAAQLGIPTAASDVAAKAVGLDEGFDVGSGLRWNNIVSKAVTGEAPVMDSFATIKYATDVAAALKVIGRYLAKEPVSDGELRRAENTISILVGQKGLTELMFDQRGVTPQGPASRGSKERTNSDLVGKFIGLQTISGREELLRQKRIVGDKKDWRSDYKQNANAVMDEYARGRPEQGQEAIMNMIRANPMGNIANDLVQIEKQKHIPQSLRDLMDRNPNVVQRRMELGNGR